MLIFDKCVAWLIYAGMPAVFAYHAVCGNIFLNTAAEDAKGLEKIGDTLLSPVQYVLCGNIAKKEGEGYRIEQRFRYEDGFAFKVAASYLALPVALPLGSACKALAFLSKETRDRHEKLVYAKESLTIVSNHPYYTSIGLPMEDAGLTLDSPAYVRKPGDELKLAKEKTLLKDIVSLLKAHHIPFWVDCGTCIGTYRYGGAIPWDSDIDIAVLLPDFDNVVHALNGLDKTKYQVQDWSNRLRPKTYLRVYIKENHSSIDIYCFAINEEKKELQFILSNEVSPFMAESWKIRERRFCVPSSFETVFPLRKALFDGIEVFVPHQTKKYLQERYGENLNPVRLYNDKTGEYEKDLSHPYWKLPHVYN